MVDRTAPSSGIHRRLLYEIIPCRKRGHPWSRRKKPASVRGDEIRSNQRARARRGRLEVGGKTVWEWMQLLIVPIALSLITLAFTWQQDTRQQKIEDRRAEVERAVEEQRCPSRARDTGGTRRICSLASEQAKRRAMRPCIASPTPQTTGRRRPALLQFRLMRDHPTPFLASPEG
jgi:hypothetical protein